MAHNAVINPDPAQVISLAFPIQKASYPLLFWQLSVPEDICDVVDEVAHSTCLTSWVIEGSLLIPDLVRMFMCDTIPASHTPCLSEVTESTQYDPCATHSSWSVLLSLSKQVADILLSTFANAWQVH